MTKIDWDRPKRVPSLRKANAFPARYPGTCANCKANFGVLVLVRRNANGQMVHANTCPQKSPIR